VFIAAAYRLSEHHFAEVPKAFEQQAQDEQTRADGECGTGLGGALTAPGNAAGERDQAKREQADRRPKDGGRMSV
jgi:hypothetical protein